MSNLVLQLISYPERNEEPKFAVYRKLAATVDLDTFRYDLNLFLKNYEDERVTSSKRVIVLDVDEAVASTFYDKPGNPIPRNGRYASPVESGHTFTSAIEASRHLGFNNHEVAIFLSKARNMHKDDAEADQRTAKVRGVTLIYDADHALSYRD